MIEQLRSAGDQLRAAWDNYFKVYSSEQYYDAQRNKLHAYGGLPSEFSCQLDTELAFISSYESKIQQIKTAIHCARNYCSGLAPITSIPPEIMIRIFHHARPEPCSLARLTKYDHTYYPGYPDSVAQVCTLWRRAAISDCSLWCHIDLSLDESCCAGLFRRAKTHVARAGEELIELHIAAGQSWEAFLDYDRLSNLLSNISSRVKTVGLTVLGGFPDFYRSVFRKILLSQRPALTKLVVSSGHNHRNTFIISESAAPPVSHSGSGHFTLDLTEDEIESSFAPLTALHLRGIFPVWSSTAYQGLVDLRLLSSNGCSGISAARLITILESSPGLQILHFGLKFYGSTGVIEQASPIHLADLRAIKVFPDGGESIALRPSRVLRLLAPGSSSVSLRLGGHYKPNTTLLTDLEGFFERSRVVRFCTRAAFPPMGILHVFHLECVVIDGLKLRSRDELPSIWLQEDNPNSLPRPGSMHITRSVLSEPDLCLLRNFCPDGIVMHSCKVNRESGHEVVELNAQELSEAFPTVTRTEYTHDPTADWDILD